MPLLQEVLKHLIEENGMELSPAGETGIEELAKSECVRALEEIKSALDDDTLSDLECISHIVRVYERLGVQKIRADPEVPPHGGPYSFPRGKE